MYMFYIENTTVSVRDTSDKLPVFKPLSNQFDYKRTEIPLSDI